jgi:hypothetical protein
MSAAADLTLSQISAVKLVSLPLCQGLLLEGSISKKEKKKDVIKKTLELMALVGFASSIVWIWCRVVSPTNRIEPFTGLTRSHPTLTRSHDSPHTHNLHKFYS